MRACQINWQAWDVEELEGQLLEWEGRLLEREELDDITLCCELVVLSTRESNLERREAYLDRERKALEDARVQVLAHELDADSREAGLRDHEARLVARERQPVEQQMKELAEAQKGLYDLHASLAREAQCVWSFLGQANTALASFGFSPV
jgi:hypothetical protein